MNVQSCVINPRCDFWLSLPFGLITPPIPNTDLIVMGSHNEIVIVSKNWSLICIYYNFCNLSVNRFSRSSWAIRSCWSDRFSGKPWSFWTARITRTTRSSRSSWSAWRHWNFGTSRSSRRTGALRWVLGVITPAFACSCQVLDSFTCLSLFSGYHDRIHWQRRRIRWWQYWISLRNSSRRTFVYCFLVLIAFCACWPRYDFYN